jgi:hypothetical protein
MQQSLNDPSLGMQMGMTSGHLASTGIRGAVTRQARWKQRRLRLRQEIATNNWRIEPGQKLVQSCKVDEKLCGEKEENLHTPR